MGSPLTTSSRPPETPTSRSDQCPLCPDDCGPDVLFQLGPSSRPEMGTDSEIVQALSAFDDTERRRFPATVTDELRNFRKSWGRAGVGSGPWPSNAGRAQTCGVMIITTTARSCTPSQLSRHLELLLCAVRWTMRLGYSSLVLRRHVSPVAAASIAQFSPRTLSDRLLAGDLPVQACRAWQSVRADKMGVLHRSRRGVSSHARSNDRLTVSSCG